MAPSTQRAALQLFKVSNFGSKSKKNKNKIVIAPPFVYLSLIKLDPNFKQCSLAAQNVFWEVQDGAYTGEISPIMLKNLGVEYVILGHSERRFYFNENNEMINKKIQAALQVGLKIILCVGEPTRKKIEGNSRGSLSWAKKYISKQLEECLKGINLDSFGKNVIIAYEPVWAISSNAGHADNPSDSRIMIQFIKSFLQKFLKISSYSGMVIYGGSITAANINSFLQYPEIDGVLVGRASLDLRELRKIDKILE